MRRLEDIRKEVNAPRPLTDEERRLKLKRNEEKRKTRAKQRIANLPYVDKESEQVKL